MIDVKIEQPMKVIAVSDVQAIVNYLKHKPYVEVAGIIPALMQLESVDSYNLKKDLEKNREEQAEIAKAKQLKGLKKSE